MELKHGHPLPQGLNVMLAALESGGCIQLLGEVCDEEEDEQHSQKAPIDYDRMKEELIRGIPTYNKMLQQFLVMLKKNRFTLTKLRRLY